MGTTLQREKNWWCTRMSSTNPLSTGMMASAKQRGYCNGTTAVQP
jgi:hypothetical protein